MRIGVIGWYGHDNAGDERILVVVRRYFAADDLVITHSFADALQRIEELNGCDYVLIGGGGLILRGSGIHAPLIEQLQPSFSCVGISVEAVHDDNQALIDVIVDRADLIYVRDEPSGALLGNHEKVVVGPDLVFLYPFEPVPVVSDDICGINLRAWPYWLFQFRSRADRWMRSLDARIPQLRALYPLPQWKPERAVALVNEQFATVRPFSLYAEAGHVTDGRVLRRYFPDVSDPFDPAVMASCRYVVAMRLHALIFACQMGIPFISLSYQPKNASFCRQAGVPHLSVPLAELDRLPLLSAELKERHAALREQLIQFTREQEQLAHRIMAQVVTHMPVRPPH